MLEVGVAPQKASQKCIAFVLIAVECHGELYCYFLFHADLWVCAMVEIEIRDRWV